MNVIERKLEGELLLNEPLMLYTTWRVGGPAKRLYKPSNLADLIHFLQTLPASEPLLWLGLGSNSLISDHGFDGTVIITQGGLKAIALEDNQVRVEAGVSCATMARFCARNQLADAEFWAGIPGTMGGALRMNAGCHNGETWQHVVSVETIDRSGQIKRRSPDSFQVAYREVQGLAPDEWFVAATYAFKPGNKEQSLETIKSLLERRAQTQPTNEYNCGSVFRNPKDNFAAKFIEAAGLKGHQIGGAMVSTKHANFIINHAGMASAHDIETLIRFVQDKVYADAKIELHREVHLIGEHHA